MQCEGYEGYGVPRGKFRYLHLAFVRNTSNGMSLASERRAQNPDPCTGAGIAPMESGKSELGDRTKFWDLVGPKLRNFEYELRPARPQSRPRASCS